MGLSKITIRQLEAFVEVSEQRSFACAARELSLSSSAISQLISELESSLGFRVFDRSTRRVDLSGAGREYLAAAQAVVSQLKRTEVVAADVRDRAAGIVRIGAPQVLASMYLPAAIQTYSASKPKVVLRIIDISVDSLIDAVAHAQVDIAVGPDRRHGPEVSRVHVSDSPWVLWCAATHPLALTGNTTLTWQELQGIPLVATGRDYEQFAAQMHTDSPCEDRRGEPVEVVQNITTALGMVAQGHFVTLAPSYVGVLAERFGLVKRRVINSEIIRSLCLYQSAIRTITPAAEAFGEFLAEWLVQHASNPDYS